MASTVWRLLGSTGKCVECCVEQTPSSVHAVTIVIGSETLMNECYPDAASALRRAMHVRDGLLTSGGWRVAVDAAVPDVPPSRLRSAP